METTVISLGGSLIVPDKIDSTFLKGFKTLIEAYVAKGNRAIIVTGGGNTSREYQKAASDASQKELDWIGIAATKLNAHLVRSLFGELAYDKVLDDPSEFVETDRNILIGSGFRPGCSSDKDAVLLAKTYGAKSVINLTNVDYVYDKNPKEHKDAKPFKKMDWEEFNSLFGTEWKPGMHAPFDPIAAMAADEEGITVIVTNGEKLDNLKGILDGSDFEGTVIACSY